MEVSGYNRTWPLENLEDLKAVLAWRDAKGGALLWFADPHPNYPQLAIRISGECADIHYFPEKGHPGFRCLGGEGLPEGGMTTLVFEGGDPGRGEETPNEFVVSLPIVWLVAKEFFASKVMSSSVSWYDL
jgi:hypothetical protein